jgi:hypothetical protein
MTLKFEFILLRGKLQLKAESAMHQTKKKIKEIN